MPTPKETLKTAIETILTQGLTYTDGAAAKEYIATELSDAIDEYTTSSIVPDDKIKIRDDFFAAGNFITLVGSGGSVTFGTFRELTRRNTPTKAYCYGSAFAIISAAVGSRSATISGNAPIKLNTGVTDLEDVSVESVIFDTNALYVNPALDPVLHMWGLLSAWGAYPNAATHGVYFRNPLTTESSFMRLVVMQAGVEVLNLPTTISFTSVYQAACKVNFTWDASANALTLEIRDGVTTYQHTISSFSTTYASVYAATLAYGIGVFRNGTGTTMLARGIGADYVQIEFKKQW